MRTIARIQGVPFMPSLITRWLGRVNEGRVWARGATLMMSPVVSRRAFRAFLYACLLLVPVVAAATTVRIVQTNAAGDNIHLIDPATNKVVGIISGIEVNHGAVVAPDGKLFYFTNEADHTLDVVDATSLKVTKQIPLTGRPNNLSISPDGRRIYIALRGTPGGVDI